MSCKRRVEALPGVTSVAFADGTAAEHGGQHNNFDLEQYPTPPGESQPVTPWVAVTPDYVRTLGLTLVEGRLLDERDAQRRSSGSLLSVMVDRAWARRFFPNESAVGKRFETGGCTDCPWTTVVGVVSDVKYDGVSSRTAARSTSPLIGRPARFVVVRTEGDPLAIAPSLQQVVRDLEPSAPLSERGDDVDHLVDQSLARPQSLSLLVTSFAAVALLLSVIGIYGVMGYYVQQHLKEISIRMALGGSQSDVARLVLGQGMTVVGIGIAVGLAIALGDDATHGEPALRRRRDRSAAFSRPASLLFASRCWRAQFRRSARCGYSRRRCYGTNSLPRTRSCEGGSRQRSLSTRMRRRIFPDGDFGIASTNATCRTRL